MVHVCHVGSYCAHIGTQMASRSYGSHADPLEGEPQCPRGLPSQASRDSSSAITFGDASPEYPPCVLKALPHEGDPKNGLDSYVVLTTVKCCCRCPTAEGAESTRPRLACTDCTVFVTLHSLWTHGQFCVGKEFKVVTKRKSKCSNIEFRV